MKKQMAFLGMSRVVKEIDRLSIIEPVLNTMEAQSIGKMAERLRRVTQALACLHWQVFS